MANRVVVIASLLVIAGLVVTGICLLSEPSALDESGVETQGGRAVVLLLHGMTWRDDESAASIWGVPASAASDEPDGMIRSLQQHGFRFGGVIRPTGNSCRLPDCLDGRGAVNDPSCADLFCLEFSRSANVDGLAYKAGELASCLEALRAFTGSGRIRLVAHSAGGLVARMYLQNGAPRVSYPGGVDRLITIGSPHLGCALATKLGDLLGTQASSLQPQAETIRRLSTAELPRDIRYAAIVVRSIGSGSNSPGEAYRDLVNQERLAGLPVDFRRGGDQIVHVCSQNLALAPCAKPYEEATGRPVHSILVRVPDPNSLVPFEQTTHIQAPLHAEVKEWVTRLLTDDGRFWTTPVGAERQWWVDEQIRQCAFSAIEQQAIERHELSRIIRVDVASLEPLDGQGDSRACRFSGAAVCRDWFTRKAGKVVQESLRRLPAHSRDSSLAGMLAKVRELGLYHKTEATGRMDVELDSFGRVVCCRLSLDRVLETSSATPP